MRFEVPQFIEIEDKIFGPLTWRQFVYLGGGLGGAVGAYLFFSMFGIGWVTFAAIVVLCIPLALAGVTLAFVKINNRPFIYTLEAMFGYVTNGRLYLWRRKSATVYKDSAAREKPVSVPLQASNRGSTHTSITSLTRSLELQALQKPDS